LSAVLTARKEITTSAPSLTDQSEPFGIMVAIPFCPDSVVLDALTPDVPGKVSPLTAKIDLQYPVAVSKPLERTGPMIAEQYVHSLDFECPNCNEPISTSLPSCERSIEDQLQFHLICRNCKLETQAFGAMATLRAVMSQAPPVY
jgi:hypothetical protein